MSYKIKCYACVLNKTEKRKGIYTAMSSYENIPIFIKGITDLVIENAKEIEGNNIKLEIYIRGVSKFENRGIEYEWKEIEKRKV